MKKERIFYKHLPGKNRVLEASISFEQNWIMEMYVVLGYFASFKSSVAVFLVILLVFM